MARPLKIGLDYFPLDVSFDDNIELIEAEEGLEGFAILIKLWQKIYSNGYYIDWNDDSVLLFTKKINSEIIKVNSVVNTCLRRNLFNKVLYEKYKILTSCGIQKRFISACSQSKRKSISVISDYMLVNSEFIELITEFIELTPEESTQSKVKERKVNEIKVNTDLEKNKKNFKTWTLEEFQEQIKENRSGYSDKELWAFFNYWSEKDAKGKMKFQLQKTWETEKRLITWSNNSIKFTAKNNTQNQKDEMGEAFKESLMHQLNKIKSE